MNKNNIIIDDVLYTTKNENDRRFIGIYEENKLLKHFINNNIKIEHISQDNKYSFYDFIIYNDVIKYIIELKSRLGNIKNHLIEFLPINKIENYKKLYKDDKNIKFIFIFNHIDTEENNKNDYYYYEIDFNNFDLFKFSNAYELPIRQLKPLEQFLNILKS
jgi:hypothetical protein